ncbi:MAG: hypothetical protein J3Q66DRAFT_375983 [Benniella sp.]|nr:MAG: hypothetical protein J3Q66DRAFT_375983 [Benniella sp.]
MEEYHLHHTSGQSQPESPDDAHFTLMESVKEFLEDEQHQVFLLLGDFGAGKSNIQQGSRTRIVGVLTGKRTTKNLYIANRLNQADEWQAKMVTSEYIGADYLGRFQPGDRN